MEIYKAMVLQKREIKVKTFDMGDDSVLRETGSITLLPTKAKLESIVNNYILYKAQAGKISDYLDKYIKATFEKNEKSSEDAYNGYGWYRNNASRTGDGGAGERNPNADRIGQDESDQVSNSPNIKG